MKYLFNQAGNIECCQWCLLSHFHHHSVTGGKGRAKLPGLHQQREVPLQGEKRRKMRSKSMAMLPFHHASTMNDLRLHCAL